MRSPILFCIMLIWCLLPVSAQDKKQQYVTVSGYIKSASTGEGIQDAEIHVPGISNGIITNEDGYFSLKLRKEPKSLLISAIGYRNHNYQLKNATDKNQLEIKMIPNTTVLSDVLVYSPNYVVGKAIEKIPNTFSKQPEHFFTFYRETIRKQRRYVSLSEAVLEMYKTRYSEPVDRDMVRIMKGRKLLSQRGRDSIAIKVMGGPNEAIYLDLVKNRDYLLNEDELEHYYLIMEEGMEINDRPQYVISFKPKHVLEKPLYYGKMYIDKELLAFTHIEMSLDVSDVDKATNLMLVHKPLRMRFKPKELTTYIHYYYDGTCSRINYMRNMFNFNCDWKKRGSSTNYTAVSEMVVTEHQVAEGSPVRKGSLRYTDVFDSKVGNFSDPEFWEDYNILEPSENLEHAVKKLKKRAVTK